MRVALIGGQGWPATETLAGLPKLQARLLEKGFAVHTFGPGDRQAIRDYLFGHSPIALIGDSLGARAAIYAGDQAPHEVLFVGGFQPSAWDPMGEGEPHSRVLRIASNVRFAHCIWDPVWADTAGLGNAHYVISPQAKTILTLTEHRGAHPDDWGYAQDLMFTHFMQIANKGEANARS